MLTPGLRSQHPRDRSLFFGAEGEDHVVAVSLHVLSEFFCFRCLLKEAPPPTRLCFEKPDSSGVSSQLIGNQVERVVRIVAGRSQLVAQRGLFAIVGSGIDSRIPRGRLLLSALDVVGSTNNTISCLGSGQRSESDLFWNGDRCGHSGAQSLFRKRRHVYGIAPRTLVVGLLLRERYRTTSPNGRRQLKKIQR
jgi:hypothetical protein